MIEDEAAQASLLPRYSFDLTRARDAMGLWMGGSTYKTIQLSLKPGARLDKLNDARRFVRNGINDIAYAVGLIGQTVALSDLEGKDDIQSSTASAAALVKEGFDSPEKLALYYRLRAHRWTRVGIHVHSESLLRYLRPREAEWEDFAQTQRRVGDAVRQLMERNSLDERDMKPGLFVPGGD